MWLDTFGEYLDWLGISIDSTKSSSNTASGRVLKGNKVQHLESLEHYLLQAKLMGIQVKINTVVSSFNVTDYLGDFILSVKPDRWKIFQALPIEGANDMHDFEISAGEYQCFLDSHAEVLKQVNHFPETNELMTSSYLMVNPEGRFYQNTTGKHTYSDPILEVGIDKALQQIEFDHDKFVERGGISAMKRKSETPVH